MVGIGEAQLGVFTGGGDAKKVTEAGGISEEGVKGEAGGFDEERVNGEARDGEKEDF